MITDIDEHFANGCVRYDPFAKPGCSTGIWQDGLVAQRRVCRACGLEEMVKWG